jgi:uncharacterized protein (TIGR02147 family)
MQIFEFRNYKTYLNGLIQIRPSSFTRELCESSSIHRSYFSQMINAEKDLSLEQAKGVCEFLPLSVDETEYFLLLVQKERSGTSSLRSFFEKKLKEIRESQTDFSKNRQKSATLNKKQMELFHSSWSYSMIMILLHLDVSPKLNTAQTLRSKLDLSIEHIQETLQGLASLGLAKFDKNIWIPTTGDIHFPKSEYYTRKSNTNLKTFALNRTLNPNPEDDQFFMTCAMSEEVHEEFRTKLKSFLNHFMSERIGPSESEVAVMFTYDLLKI